MSFEQFLQAWGINPEDIDSLDQGFLQTLVSQYETDANNQGIDQSTLLRQNELPEFNRDFPTLGGSGNDGLNFGQDYLNEGQDTLGSLPPWPGTSGDGQGNDWQDNGGQDNGGQGWNSQPNTPGNTVGNTSFNRPTSGYRPSDPFFNVSTTNPQQMGEQDRLASWAWLHGMNQGLEDDRAYYNNQEDFYNNALMGPGGYGGILSGQTGYSPEEASNVLQQGQIESALPTSDELDDLALRDYDYASIPGDPWSTRDAYSGLMDQLWQIGSDADSNQRGVAQAYGTNLDSTIDPLALGVDQNYGSNRRGVIDSYGQFLQDSGAYGERAKIDDLYAQEQINNSDAYAQDLASFNPNRFNLSDEFNANYNFSPEDEQQLANQASRDAGARYQATADRVIRNASNTSNATPLAIAAALKNLDSASSRAGADAATDARIRGRQLGLSATANKEGMRLGSEQRVADQLNRSAGQIADFRRGTLSDIETRRVAGEQFAADKAGSLGNDLYLQYGDLIRDEENRRLESARDIASRRFESADRGGRAVMDTEKTIADRNVGLGQFNVQTMGGATERAENTAADRAKTLAEMRMSGAANRIGTRFQTNMGAANAMRSGFQDVYGASRNDAKEGRGFLANQSQNLANTGRAITQQRIGSAGTGFSAANAGSVMANATKNPALWERLLNMGVNAAAGAVAGGG